MVDVGRSQGDEVPVQRVLRPLAAVAVAWAGLTLLAPTMPPPESGSRMAEVARLGAAVLGRTAVVAGVALLAARRLPSPMGQRVGGVLRIGTWLVGAVPTVGFALIAWYPT